MTLSRKKAGERNCRLTFELDKNLRYAFKSKCADNHTSMNERLIAWIKSYLASTKVNAKEKYIV